MAYVALYLGAVVAANLTVAAFGPDSVFLVAFFLVAFDLVCRDQLHDLFSRRRYFPVYMAGLIAAGGVLSYLVNAAAGPIAIASTIAFAGAAVADTLVYVVLRRRRWLVRSNASNVAGAAVDSILFPTIAFGAFLPAIVFGQFAAKVAGGVLWSYVFRPRFARDTGGTSQRRGVYGDPWRAR